MTAPTTEEIMGRIAATLGAEGSCVRPDVALADLVSESYRLVELAIELQDDYDVIFTQADLSAISTVADLAELVRSRARPDSPPSVGDSVPDSTANRPLSGDDSAAGQDGPGW